MKHVPDVMMVAGSGLLSYGAWQIYPPAGFIVAGILIIIAGVKAAN